LTEPLEIYGLTGLIFCYIAAFLFRYFLYSMLNVTKLMQNSNFAIWAC